MWRSLPAGATSRYWPLTASTRRSRCSGLVAGERGEDDKFPEDSVHGRADARLREMGEAMRQFGRRGRNGVTPDRPDGEAEPVVPAETGEEPAAGTEH